MLQTRTTADNNEKFIDEVSFYFYGDDGGLMLDTIVSVSPGSTTTINFPDDKNADEVKKVVAVANTGVNDLFQLPEASLELGYDNLLPTGSASLGVDMTKLAWQETSNSVVLPFVGSDTSVVNRTATVELQRKVARIEIANKTGYDAKVDIKNLTTAYKQFLTDNGIITKDSIPGTVGEFPGSITKGGTKVLYVLPNPTGNMSLHIEANKSKTSKGVAIFPNMKYKYNLVYKADNSFDLELSYTENWNNSANDEDITVNELPIQIIEPNVKKIAAGLKPTDVTLNFDESSTIDYASLQATSDQFTVTFTQTQAVTRAESTEVITAHITPKKPYLAEDKVGIIKIADKNKGHLILQITQAKFEFGKVQMGAFVYMDRDLGADAIGNHGEVYLPGHGYVDQANAKNQHNGKFTGGARSFPSATAYVTLDNFFDKEDPCPKGWHTMTGEEAANIFHVGTDLQNRHGQQYGNYDFNTGGNIGGLNASVTKSATALTLSHDGATLIFALGHGHLTAGTWMVKDADFGPGWWVNGKHTHADNNETNYISLTYAKGINGGRIQCRPNKINDFGAQRALMIRCVQDNQPSN